MLCCTDVAYGTDKAVAAALFFSQWTDSGACDQKSVECQHFGDYRAGEFYKRELPVLVDLLTDRRDQLDVILIDGYVWLGDGRAGLGKHLYDAFEQQIPVIGVAKSSFHDNTDARSVLRGNSKKPLWVTAAGITVAEAARGLESMHGAHRLPTLLKATDRLGRDLLDTKANI